MKNTGALCHAKAVRSPITLHVIFKALNQAYCLRSPAQCK